MMPVNRPRSVAWLTSPAFPGPLAVALGTVALVVGLALSASGQGAAPSAKSPSVPKWEVLHGCQLLEHAENDGDTFYTLWNGKPFIFRLYSVDAPEMDSTLPDRVTEQAAYFGISRDQVPELAQAAKRHAAEFLKDGFTAVTCWQKARGPGSMERFFALLRVGERDLARELVAQGLVRIHGPAASWPEPSKTGAALRELRLIEADAKAQGAGGWRRESGVAARPTPRAASTPLARLPSQGLPAPVVSAQDPPAELPPALEPPAAALAADPAEHEPKLIDLNSATRAELESIPGIGPVLAQRIIAGRPYASVEELSKLKGIKDRMIEKLRPFVTVGK